MKKICALLFLFYSINNFLSAQSSDKKMFAEGVKYVHAENYVRALELFNTISNEYKAEHSEVVYYSVLSYIKVGALHKADKTIADYNGEIKTPHKEKSFLEIDAFLNTSLTHFQNYLLGAEQKEQENDFRGALELIDKAIAMDSFYAEGFVKRAYAGLGLKDYNNVIKDCNTALVLDNKSADAWVYKGWAYYYQQNYQVAIECYSTALALKPSEAIYCQRAVTFYRMKDYDPAMKDLDIVIKLNAKNEYAYYLKGAMYFEQRNYEMALININQALALGSRDVNIYLFQGESLVYLQKDKQAMESFDKAIETDPENGYPYYDKAKCFLSINDYYKKENHLAAIKLYDRAIELDPEDEDFYYYRAVSKKMCNEYDAAIADLNKAIKINKLDWYNYDERNTCHELKRSAYRIRKQDLYEAIHVYKADVVQQRATDNESYLNMAKTYDLLYAFLQDQSYVDTALQVLNVFIKNNPTNARAYVQRGKFLYFAKAEYGNAVRDYSAAIKYDSSMYSTYLSLGWAYMANNEPAKAYDVFVYVKQRFPQTIGIVEQYIEESCRRMNKK